VPPVPNDSATALALDAEAEECPSERGEILLEAAAAWQRAGDGAQSRALLEGLVAGGGHDACYARVELAAQLFEQDLRDDALARIAELARDPALDEGHCQSAAELLAQHGLLRESLRWYDRFVARLSPDRLDAVAGEDGWLSFESVPLRGRREVRRELGLPPDVTDEIAPDPPPNALENLAAGFARVRKREVVERMLIFQRAERAEAARCWPDLYDDDPGHFAEVERRRRAHAESGGQTVIVPGTVAGLVAFAEEHGGSARDQEVRRRYCMAIPDDQALPWPPARNAPCWCGSGFKYKKCCGRPGLG
jgi:SEC-C motif